MTTTKKITSVIGNLREGQVFTYDQLGLKPDEYRAAVKALVRMANKGVIKRAGVGKYYLPAKTVFGELKPAEEELIKPYLFNKGKRIAYITGAALYNRLGLSTQIPKTIKVASRDRRIITKVGSVQVKPVKSYVDVTSENFHVLEILDAIKDFKDISDLNRKDALARLKHIIEGLTQKERKQLLNYALKYPPRARALTGALLMHSGWEETDLQKLCDSLNPLSEYNFGITVEELPEIIKWNIK
ncbi:DUF6088 family protein [Filimonas effusa]|uniref:AbiEi antitoxin C-terminal domain-containing protein n=1 Tax=Filimonas effusa TaxID=2508721 RepID=A0A4Q1DCR0_9BACT|nr:DUF6088 family protein [Filimonas effusa]RXK87291.1 hypothetical protein ESB13_11085 [Filimonas effusa]